MRSPPSPCIGVCRLDPATGWCLGCMRTLAEIADWRMLGDAEKADLLARLDERQWPHEQSGGPV